MLPKALDSAAGFGLGAGRLSKGLATGGAAKLICTDQGTAVGAAGVGTKGAGTGGKAGATGAGLAGGLLGGAFRTGVAGAASTSMARGGGRRSPHRDIGLSARHFPLLALLLPPRRAPQAATHPNSPWTAKPEKFGAPPAATTLQAPKAADSTQAKTSGVWGQVPRLQPPNGGRLPRRLLRVLRLRLVFFVSSCSLLDGLLEGPGHVQGGSVGPERSLR